jgi:hypothetical protein
MPLPRRSSAVLVAFLIQSCASATGPKAASRTSLAPISISGPFNLVAWTFPDVSTPGFWYVASFVNQSKSDETVSFAGCWSFLQLYRTADRTGAPVFDTESTTHDCDASSQVKLTPKAGSAASLSSQIDFAMLKKEGVPPGHYYLSVRIAPNGEQSVVPAGELTVAP